MRKFSIQLQDHRSGSIIEDSGGVCFVATADGSAKATLYDADGGSLANPVALNQGHIDFHVADAINTVDLYIMAPGGHFVTLSGVAPSGPNEIMVDQGVKAQVAIIPFDVADQTGDATETDSGFDEPANAMFSTAAVRMVTVDAAITVDVGTDSGDSGDADGLLDGISTAVAGVIPGTLADGAATLGVLLSTDESAGDLVPEVHVSTEKSITWTLLTAANTAVGFIILPYTLTT